MSIVLVHIALLPQLLVADGAHSPADHKSLDPQQYAANDSKHSTNDGDVQTPVGLHLPTANRNYIMQYGTRCGWVKGSWGGGMGDCPLKMAVMRELQKKLLKKERARARDQFSPFFPVLHRPLGLAELQACPFPDVVFPPLPLSALSSSPFHCALKIVL